MGQCKSRFRVEAGRLETHREKGDFPAAQLSRFEFDPFRLFHACALSAESLGNSEKIHFADGFFLMVKQPAEDFIRMFRRNDERVHRRFIGEDDFLRSFAGFGAVAGIKTVVDILCVGFLAGRFS